MALVQFQEAPSRGKKTYGNSPAGHPCPIAKGLGDAMREILDFCIFMSKTELWKLTARRDAYFHRPVPNLFSISIILSMTVLHCVRVFRSSDEPEKMRGMPCLEHAQEVVV
jgi:hypothetical protein